MNFDEINKSIEEDIMKAFSIPYTSIYGSASTCSTQEERTLTIESLNASLKSMQDALLGFRVIESRWLTRRVQFRFPRTRKKRMMKKWARNPHNFKDVPSTDAYHTPFGLICHPEIAKKIRSAIQLGNTPAIARGYARSRGEEVR